MGVKSNMLSKNFHNNSWIEGKTVRSSYKGDSKWRDLPYLTESLENGELENKETSNTALFDRNFEEKVRNSVLI